MNRIDIRSSKYLSNSKKLRRVNFYWSVLLIKYFSNCPFIFMGQIQSEKSCFSLKKWNIPVHSVWIKQLINYLWISEYSDYILIFISSLLMALLKLNAQEHSTFFQIFLMYLAKMDNRIWLQDTSVKNLLRLTIIKIFTASNQILYIFNF